MTSSTCICSPGNKVPFEKKIEYKNETVFKAFEGIIIAQCTQCGMYRTFFRGVSTFDPQQSRGEYYEENIHFFEELFRPLVNVIKRYAKGKSVLDVGCSSGILLQLLQKQGYNIQGIEPNKQAFQMSKKKLADKVFYGTLSDYVSGKHMLFDVIIYNHVLEHIKDPLQELEKVSRVMGDEGILVIGVPNRQNIIFFLRQKYWEPLMPLEHIWLFSPQDLKRLLVNQGFDILDISFSDDSRKDYPLLKRLYFQFLTFINKCLGTGEAMLIVAKKS